MAQSYCFRSVEQCSTSTFFSTPGGRSTTTTRRTTTRRQSKHHVVAVSCNGSVNGKFFSNTATGYLGQRLAAAATTTTTTTAPKTTATTTTPTTTASAVASSIPSSGTVYFDASSTCPGSCSNRIQRNVSIHIATAAVMC